MKILTKKRIILFIILLFFTIMTYHIYITLICLSEQKIISHILDKVQIPMSLEEEKKYKENGGIRDFFKNYNGERVSINRPQVISLNFVKEKNDIVNLIVIGVGKIKQKNFIISFYDESNRIFGKISIKEKNIVNALNRKEILTFTYFFSLDKRKEIPYSFMVEQEISIEIYEKIYEMKKIYAKLNDIKNSQNALLYNYFAGYKKERCPTHACFTISVGF